MKALLLVGGYATRLQPLSITRPKCLFPLGGVSIIDQILYNLAKSGVDEAVLAVNNLADEIEEHLGTEKHGVKLHYNLEEEPLGTGGPIKLAENLLNDDDFFVLNGDVLSYIDYAEQMTRHKKRGTIGTLTLKDVEDPSRYGVVRFGPDNRIDEFVEKPSKEEAPSNWINAGCYALSPEIFNYIPSSRKVSIEREVFPVLAEKKQLYGYRYSGEWIDIGVPGDYLKADRMLGPPVYGKNTVIGDSIVENTIIWENTRIGDNCSINGAIIGANVTIGDNVEIGKGSVIADKVTIPDNITIGNNCKIYPNTVIDMNLEPQTVYGN